MENDMELNEAVKSKIEDYVKNNKVVLFMKGTPQQPQCGFSAKTIAALDSVVPVYTAVNVLDDAEIREGIKVYGDWPTIPQLYIDGELVGGCDIVLNMFNSGELHQQLGLEAPDRTPPEITITEAAAEKSLRPCRAMKALACTSRSTPTGTRSSTWRPPRVTKSPANPMASRC